MYYMSILFIIEFYNTDKEGKKVLSSIEDEILLCDEFKISVAFITMGGITPLLQTLRELEKMYGLHSIAFPAISTGVYGYPMQEAAEIAIAAILDWLNVNAEYEMQVTLSCFSRQTYDAYQRVMEKQENTINRQEQMKICSVFVALQATITDHFMLY